MMCTNTTCNNEEEEKHRNINKTLEEVEVTINKLKKYLIIMARCEMYWVYSQQRLSSCTGFSNSGVRYRQTMCS